MHAFDLQTVFRLLCESSTASGSLRSRLETRPVSRDADSRAGISLDFADTCLRRTADAMQTSLSIMKKQGRVSKKLYADTVKTASWII